MLIFFLHFKLFYCCSSTVVCIYPLPFPSSHPSHPHLLPCFHPLLVLSMLSFIVIPENPSSRLSPPTSPLVTVSLFLFSMFLVIFWLLVCFVDYVPVKGEIIWYLSLTPWLISLSIMLSSSIHAVAKGRSFFFLSAA